MSEYQRFVTYINRYEGNNKVNNAGFAKIESKGEQCTIEIHMKNTGYTGISCPVHLFVREGGRLLGILIGKLQLTNGSGDGRFLISGDNINQTGYNLKHLGGFMIFATEQVMFASLWDDGGIEREMFSELQAPELEKEVAKKKEGTIPAKMDSKPEEREVLKVAEAVPCPRLVVKEERQERSWEEQWRFILESYPVLTPFEEQTEVQAVRIELKDLRLLPRCYWYLGNNSFLLHGFFNYRYLILGAMEQEGKKRWFLGVPGIFQSQEKVMAAVFGFPEYGSEKIAQLKTGQFGYWYRFLMEASE